MIISIHHKPQFKWFSISINYFVLCIGTLENLGLFSALHENVQGHYQAVSERPSSELCSLFHLIEEQKEKLNHLAFDN